MDGHKMLTLALVWQLMRAYTLSLLSKLNPGGTPVVESEIITWANSRLEANGKTECTIKSFQDKSLKDATPILELVDCIKPNSVDWSLVIKGKTLTEEVGHTRVGHSHWSRSIQIEILCSEWCCYASSLMP